MLAELKIPKARPARKVPGYQMPEDEKDLLAWDFVNEQMAQAEDCWTSTVNQGLGPHVVLLWGIWHAGRIHIDTL